MTCCFCDFPAPILGNALAFACLDKHPVTPGHLLILPRRHVPTWFDATATEQQAMMALLDEAKQWLESRFAPDGYNIGINVGDADGQTVMHQLADPLCPVATLRECPVHLRWE